MTETGIISKIDGHLAHIESESPGGCAACQMNNKCMMSTDLKKCIVIVELNEFNVSPGDKVEYSFRESYFIGISAALYLVPAMLIIFCSAIGYFAGRNFFNDLDIGVIIGFTAGVFLSIFTLLFSGKKKRNFPHIIKK